jgi:hypothetical protein
MPLTTTIQAGIQAVETISGDLQSMSSAFSSLAPVVLENGTGDNQANRKYSDTISVGTGGTELDIVNIVDSDGRTQQLSTVKALLVRASPANSGNIIVGNATAARFQGPFNTSTWTVTLPPGAGFLIYAPLAGWSSANGVNDTIKIAASATTQMADIMIIGHNA